MPVQIQLRRGTAAEWTAANPILAQGEMGLELDTNLFKIGNGITNWVSLPYGGLRGATGVTGVSIVSATANAQGNLTLGLSNATNVTVTGSVLGATGPSPSVGRILTMTMIFG